MSRTRTVLITGATSGIGLAFARLCAERGDVLVLVGRSKEKLEEVVDALPAETIAHAIVSDLSMPAAAIEVMAGVRELHLQIDMLINNAGVGQYGAFVDTDYAAEEDMMQLNMITLVQLTKVLLPQMIAQGSGVILNVASTAAFFPGPLMSIYYATKAFVLSFSEGLAEESRGTGVTVTALCPGPTATRFEERAQLTGSSLFKGRLATAEDVARIGLDAVEQGKRVVIAGRLNATMIVMSRILPRSMRARIVRYMQRPI